MIADVEGDINTLFCEGKDGQMPFLVTRNMVVFPGVVTPLLIGRQQSLRLIEVLKNNPETVIAIFCQKNENDEVPSVRDIYEWGVLARLVRTIDMPDSENVTAIFQGLGRCRRESLTQIAPYYEGSVVSDIENLPSTPEEKKQYNIAVADLREVVSEYIHKSDEMPNESEFAIKNIKNETMLVNFVCANAFFPVPEKIELLKNDNMMDRVMTLLR